MLAGTIRQIFCAVDVCHNGLRRIIFHHRHMLISGGVKNDLGLKSIESLFETLFVADVSYHKLDIAAFTVELQLEMVQRCFGLVEKHNTPRVELQQLPRYLAPD